MGQKGARFVQVFSGGFMTVRHILMFGVVLLVLGASSVSAADYVRFDQQTNNGPVNARESRNIRYEMVGTSLAITVILDSTDPASPLYMKLTFRNYNGVGIYTLGSGTLWRYGQRSDQIFTCQSGQAEVTRIDSVTNRIYGTFDWYGTATLQNGTDLTVRIRDGAFDVQIKPEIQLVATPKAGTTLKPKETGVFVIAAKKRFTNTLVSGAKIALTYPSNIFETEPTDLVTATDGTIRLNLKVKESVVDGEYRIIAKGSKDGFLDGVGDTITFKIDASGRYWFAKCNGVSWLVFDAGADSAWEDGGAPYIEADGPNVMIGEIFKVSGLVRIDTTAYSIVGNGRVWVSALGKDFTFYDGPFSFRIVPCGAALDFLSAALVEKFTGGLIKDTKFLFQESNGSVAGGKLTFTVEGPENSSQGCNPDPKGAIWTPNKDRSWPMELAFMKVDDKYEISANIGVKDLSLGPSVCLNSASLFYNFQKDSAVFNAEMKTPWFEKGTLGATVKDGKPHSGKVGLTFNTCLPLPETPFCWKGGEVTIENFVNLNPFAMSIKGLFEVTGKPDICEFDVTVGTKFPPVILTGDASVRFLKFEALSTEKPWQMESSVGIEFDMDKMGITLKGSTKAFHLGGEYMIEGSETRSVSFFNGLHIMGTLDAQLKVPNLSKELESELGLFGRFINQYTPLNIGKVSASLNLVEAGEQTMSVSYDLNNATAGLSAEAAAIMRRLGKGTMTIDFTKLPSASALSLDAGFTELYKAIFGKVESPKGDDDVQAIVTRDVIVQEGAEKLVVVISAEDGSLTSTLTAPSGTTYAASDESANLSYLVTPSGEIGLWVVDEPVAGQWTVSVTDPGSNDSIVVYAREAERPFAVTATQTGRRIVATWDSPGAPSSSTVTIVATDVAGERTGTPMMTVPESQGRAVIELTDSTAGCEFHIWARRNDPRSPADADVTGTFTNPKSRLTPPTAVTATTSLDGRGTVSWTSSPDQTIDMYAVVLRRSDGSDTVIASAYGADNRATFETEDVNGSTISIVAYDAAGRAGCPSQPVSLVVGVEDFVQSTSDFGLAPNPAGDRFSIVLKKSTSAQIDVVSTLGGVVASFSTEAGVTSPLTVNTSTWPTGTYLVRVTTDGQTTTAPLLIIR